MTRAKSVVFPAPLHPASPITFIEFSGTRYPCRHCEEQGDEAIQPLTESMDCFASLAMTLPAISFVPGDAYIGLETLSCYAAFMMKIEKTPVPLILPNPQDPRLTERVTGTDQSGASTAINVPVERPLTLY